MSETDLSDQMKNLFFFYGTLMKPEVYQNVVTQGGKKKFKPSNMSPARSFVVGYSRHPVLHPNFDYPGMMSCCEIYPKNSHQCHEYKVVGLLCHVPSQSYQRRLDIFEGEDYEVATVNVELMDEADQKIFGTKTILAKTYLWRKGAKFLDIDKPWAFEAWELKSFETFVKLYNANP
eukprot:TRINITY_DN5297_c0_g3_i2.p1 TRINITY_DN5297_c0_g3~~TRINITY_DN5297_c0_g3_i2.p1  ORF type:complete len:176 (-),score=26.77 TRINITY_DN5297_c0_g3_i2:95-622(-)